jgi:VanZ family protein
MRRVSLWLPPLVYMIVIFHFSSESNPLPEVTEHVWDKLLHLTEYAGLAFLFCRALTGEGLGWLAAAGAALLLTSVYGASDEWHQAFVPLRSVDVRDWLADTLGAALGAALYSVRQTVRLKADTTTYK